MFTRLRTEEMGLAHRERGGWGGGGRAGAPGLRVRGGMERWKGRSGVAGLRTGKRGGERGGGAAEGGVLAPLACLHAGGNQAEEVGWPSAPRYARRGEGVKEQWREGWGLC